MATARDSFDAENFYKMLDKLWRNEFFIDNDSYEAQLAHENAAKKAVAVWFDNGFTAEKNITEEEFVVAIKNYLVVLKLTSPELKSDAGKPALVQSSSGSNSGQSDAKTSDSDLSPTAQAKPYLWAFKEIHIRKLFAILTQHQKGVKTIDLIRFCVVFTYFTREQLNYLGCEKEIPLCAIIENLHAAVCNSPIPLGDLCIFRPQIEKDLKSAQEQKPGHYAIISLEIGMARVHSQRLRNWGLNLVVTFFDANNRLVRYPLVPVCPKQDKIDEHTYLPPTNLCFIRHFVADAQKNPHQFSRVYITKGIWSWDLCKLYFNPDLECAKEMERLNPLKLALNAIYVPVLANIIAGYLEDDDARLENYESSLLYSFLHSEDFLPNETPSSSSISISQKVTDEDADRIQILQLMPPEFSMKNFIIQPQMEPRNHMLSCLTRPPPLALQLVEEVGEGKLPNATSKPLSYSGHDKFFATLEQQEAKFEKVRMDEIRDFVEKICNLPLVNNNPFGEKLIPENERKALATILRKLNDETIDPVKQEICNVFTDLINMWKTTVDVWKNLKMLESPLVLGLNQGALMGTNQYKLSIAELDQAIRKKTQKPVSAQSQSSSNGKSQNAGTLSGNKRPRDEDKDQQATGDQPPQKRYKAEPENKPQSLAALEDSKKGKEEKKPAAGPASSSMQAQTQTHFKSTGKQGQKRTFDTMKGAEQSNKSDHEGPSTKKAK